MGKVVTKPFPVLFSPELFSPPGIIPGVVIAVIFPLCFFDFITIRTRFLFLLYLITPEIALLLFIIFVFPLYLDIDITIVVNIVLIIENIFLLSLY